MKSSGIKFTLLFVVVCSITLCQCCSHGPCSEKDHVEKNQHNPQQPQQHQPLTQMSAQQKQGGGTTTSTAAPAPLATTDRPVQFSNRRPDMIIQNVELNEMNDHQNNRGDQRRKRHLHFDLFEHGHHHHSPDYGFHDHHHHDYDYHHAHHHHHH